jgi:hypothetical protein
MIRFVDGIWSIQDHPEKISVVFNIGNLSEKIKRLFKPRNVAINTLPEIKMSELIEQYAADYIDMGENTEERQNHLNGACLGNIAVFPEHSREEAFRRVVAGYKRMNPDVTDADNLEHNLRAPIQKKLEMFPDIKKVIIDAMIETINETKYRIYITSTDDKESLKEIFKKQN